MMEGMKEQLLENGTALLAGHLQLHHPDYLPDRNIYDTLGGDSGVDTHLAKQLEQHPDVRAVAPRVYGFALLSTGEHSAGAQLMGVRPGSEAKVTTFLKGLTSGQALGATPAGSLLLGEGLAKELRASIGSEVAAVTQAADGSMGNALFHVAGILKTGLAHLDKTLAVAEVRDLQELLVLEQDRFHEFALRLTGPQLADQLAAEFNTGELPPGATAKSWGELAPQLRDYLALFEGMYGFMIGFVAIFAALGILNTMMMAVFERTREIGTVVSLGMYPGNIVATILVESFFLTVLGLVAGVLLSGLLMQPLMAQGLDLSRWMGELAMMNTRMDPVIRFKWIWSFVGWSAVGLLLAGMVAAALPALRAARMNPVEARNSTAEV
jgi:ABC-type lipoprotein release transport system permease subunit